MKNIGVDQCYLKGLKKYEEIMIIAISYWYFSSNKQFVVKYGLWPGEIGKSTYNKGKDITILT